jgi:DNA-binding helix-hairpin-helix protein with protein kinase domain
MDGINRRAYRERIAPDLTWGWKLAVGEQIAARVNEQHQANRVIGDIAPPNMFVSPTAWVTLVDADGWQIPDPAHPGSMFPCLFSRAEYTPPEHAANPRDRSTREPTADDFGLAVVLFQILMEGIHPFSGFPAGSTAHLEEVDNIRAGRSWVVWGREAMSIPPATLSLDVLPAGLLSGFRRCFGSGLDTPADRPTARWWRDALASAQNGLGVCPENPLHRVRAGAERCPWCARLASGYADQYAERGRAAEARRPPTRTAPPPLTRVPPAAPSPPPLPATQQPAARPTPPPRPVAAARQANRRAWAWWLVIGVVLLLLPLLVYLLARH